MAEKITYYAMFDELTSRERPRTVLRRIKKDGGTTDEIFTRDLTWEFSALLYGAERGDTMVEFAPISEAEAAQIVERIKELAASAE
jgi:hypothetical protein